VQGERVGCGLQVRAASSSVKASVRRVLVVVEDSGTLTLRLPPRSRDAGLERRRLAGSVEHCKAESTDFVEFEAGLSQLQGCVAGRDETGRDETEVAAVCCHARCTLSASWVGGSVACSDDDDDDDDDNGDNGHARDRSRYSVKTWRRQEGLAPWKRNHASYSPDRRESSGDLLISKP
jgi:hypothetical protein